MVEFGNFLPNGDFIGNVGWVGGHFSSIELVLWPGLPRSGIFTGFRWVSIVGWLV